MNDKYFLDTNIFIYTFDEAAKSKQKKAIHLVETALNNNSGVISYQVIQEFLNVATRKFSKPMPFGDAKRYLQLVLNPLCEIYPTNDLYNSALGIAENKGFSFYDSLIIAAAISANCKKVYTEDLQHGQIISGLHIVNPFK